MGNCSCKIGKAPNFARNIVLGKGLVAAYADLFFLKQAVPGGQQAVPGGQQAVPGGQQENHTAARENREFKGLCLCVFAFRAFLPVQFRAFCVFRVFRGRVLHVSCFLFRLFHYNTLHFVHKLS